MEGSYFYCSDGEEQHNFYDYTGDSYEPTNVEVWNDPDYDEGEGVYYGANPYDDSSRQPCWGWISEASTTFDEGRSQPDCSCQNASSYRSGGTSPKPDSKESRTSSDWETDDDTGSAASSTSGNTCASSADQTDSCRNSVYATSTSSWETASSEESESSWETASTCSCEAAAASTACLHCNPAGNHLRWDDDLPEDPDCSLSKERMSHPFSEGGGGSGSLVPLPPSGHLSRAPPQRRPSPYFRRWKNMTSSGVGRRQETKKRQAEQKLARGPCTIQKAISAPAANPIAARKSKLSQSKPTKARPSRRRFCWNTMQKRIRKAIAQGAMQIGDGVVGPSGKNQRRLHTASCPKAVHYHQ